MSARPGIAYRLAQSIFCMPRVLASRAGTMLRMRPFSMTSVWSASRCSESIGTTLTCASASGPCSRSGKAKLRNSRLMLVRLRLPAHRFGVEVVHLIDELVGDELSYVDLLRHAGRALGWNRH